MEVSSIGGLLQKDQLLKRGSVSAIKTHNFALRVTAGDYLDGILRQFENFCEHPLKLAICCAGDRRRRDANAQRAIMFTHDFAARRARHDNYIKGKTSTMLGMANQVQ